MGTIKQKIQELNYQRNPDIVFRRDGNESIVFVPATGNSHSLNSTAAYILELCDGNHREEDVIGRLLERYRGSETLIRRSVRQCLAGMREAGIIVCTTTSWKGRSISIEQGNIMHQFNAEKILRHLGRVAEWQATGVSRPITYELDMTNVCNSRCPYCFGFYGREKNSSCLSLADARDIIGQIRDFGGKGITFTGGGDPLCNPVTPAAVRYAHSRGLDVGFITNGLLLNERIAAILVDCCTWIRVSLDAGTPEVYRRTHGLNENAFRTVVANIKMLVRVKKTRKSNVTIGTGFLTFSEIIGDMLRFVNVSKRAGVDYAQFRPLLKKFDQTEFNRDPDKRILAAIDRCRSLATRSFQVLCSAHKYGSMGNKMIARSYDVCHGHHFAAVIAADKKMYLCCHMRGRAKYRLGDLSKQTLVEIWRSRRRKQVYRNIDFGDCPLFCRCDGFNNILWNIQKPTQHVNFL